MAAQGRLVGVTLLPFPSFFLMMIMMIVSMLLSGNLVSGLPTNATVSDNNDTSSVDICLWTDSMPLLYHEYRNNACPPNFNLQPDGINCEDHIVTSFAWNGYWDCASFCQMRTTFSYGKEQPYLRVPMCRPGFTCTLAETVHQGYNVKAKGNFNFKYSAVTLGVTGGYNSKNGKSQSYKFSKHMEDNQCGYMTFIPFVRESCGSYTEGKQYDYTTPCENLHTVGNACLDQPVRFSSNDGITDWDTIRGVVTLVYVDCVTLAPLPDDQQDPAWIQPGVRLPRDVALMNAYENLWKEQGQAPLTALSDTVYCTQTGKANATDCLDVLGDLLDNGDHLVATTNAAAGTEVSLGVSGTCTVHVRYEQDWTDGCQVSYLEVAAALQSVYDTCTNSDQSLAGMHWVRDSNSGCGSSVKFERSTTLQRA